MNDKVDRAIEQALAGFDKIRDLASLERSAWLAKTAASIRSQQEDLARLITSENGKPISDSRTEVARAEATFTIAAEEAKRIGGEVIPVDAFPQGKGKIGFTRRFPIGPIGAITPFNFPLNLVAHKAAPALACGCSVIVKPSPRTPKTAAKLLSILHESGVPKEAAILLEGGGEEAQALASDNRLKAVSFTGSAAVGWQLKAMAGKKKVLLELGGNNAVIVHEDADLSRAVERLLPGSFAYSGQLCTSTQRLYLHESVSQKFLQDFLAKAKALRLGPPEDESTDLGPMIDEAAAKRTEEWVNEAVGSGAKLLLGGKRDGRFYPPTALMNVKQNLKVSCEEIFAPVVVVENYRDFDEALRWVNDSRYGLQASVFTNSLDLALRAHEKIEAGAVIVNEIPAFRVDSMPYGGVKESGLGREGLRYAIEELTEPRLLIIHSN